MLRNLCRVILAACLLAPRAEAISIQFDYTYDTNSFFTGANVGRRTYLNAAAQVFTDRLTDSLLAISPSGGNTWNRQFFDPSGSSLLSISGGTIATNNLVIYVGAQNLGGALGEGGPGSYSASGDQAWFDTIKGRGQSGALLSTPTDFATWGGSLTFDLSASWYFDPDPATRADLPAGDDDFYSVAIHELGHLFGIGTAGSWTAKVSGNFFEGTNAKAAHGGLHVALSGTLDQNSHWAQDTSSTIFGTGVAQEVSMDPALTVGTRKFFTTLDFAGLQDVGWQIAPVPEPSSAALLGVFGTVVLLRVRRARRS